MLYFDIIYSLENRILHLSSEYDRNRLLRRLRNTHFSAEMDLLGDPHARQDFFDKVVDLDFAIRECEESHRQSKADSAYLMETLAAVEELLR